MRSLVSDMEARIMERVAGQAAGERGQPPALADVLRDLAAESKSNHDESRKKEEKKKSVGERDHRQLAAPAGFEGAFRTESGKKSEDEWFDVYRFKGMDKEGMVGIGGSASEGFWTEEQCAVVGPNGVTTEHMKKLREQATDKEAEKEGTAHRMALKAAGWRKLAHDMNKKFATLTEQERMFVGMNVGVPGQDMNDQSLKKHHSVPGLQGTVSEDMVEPFGKTLATAGVDAGRMSPRRFTRAVDDIVSANLNATKIGRFLMNELGAVVTPLMVPGQDDGRFLRFQELASASLELMTQMMLTPVSEISSAVGLTSYSHREHGMAAVPHSELLLSSRMGDKNQEPEDELLRASAVQVRKRRDSRQNAAGVRGGGGAANGGGGAGGGPVGGGGGGGPGANGGGGGGGGGKNQPVINVDLRGIIEAGRGQGKPPQGGGGPAAGAPAGGGGPGKQPGKQNPNPNYQGKPGNYDPDYKKAKPGGWEPRPAKELTTPLQGGAPRQHWARGGSKPGVLLPEERATTRKLLDWLQPLRGEGRFQEIFRIADGAVAGQPVTMVDYTGPLAGHQAHIPMGGCANKHSREFQRMFPRTRHRELHLELMNKVRFRWRTMDEQKAIREGSPGHDFGSGRAPRSGNQEFEDYRAHQAELRAKNVTARVPRGVALCHIRWFRIAKYDSAGRIKGWRNIHNCAGENPLLQRMAQRLTGVRSLSQVMRRGSWMCLADFKEFFYQFAVAWVESLRLGVPGPINRETNEVLDDDVVIALPMGGRQSPPIASKCQQALAGVLQELGISALGYVDEIHLQADSPHGAFTFMMLTAAATSWLGWQLGWDKLEIFPSQRVEFLGLVWNSRLMRRQVRWGRRVKICKAALALFESFVEGRRVPIVAKASLLGQMTSCQQGAREFGLIAVHAKVELREDLRRSGQRYDRLVAVGNRFAVVCQHVVMSPENKWWNYVRREQVSRTFTTDASCFAHGSELRGAPEEPVQSTRDRFTPEELRCSHTVQELVGTHRGMVGLVKGNGYRGTPVVPMCLLGETDNLAAKAVVEKGHSKSVAMANRHLSFMRRVLDPNHLQLRMTWMPGTTMVTDRRADAMSRQLTVWHEWPVEMWVVLEVCAELRVDPRSLVDMFTERSVARARRYVVYQGDGGDALYRNALSRSLCCSRNTELRPRDVSWAFPPPVLLGKWLQLYEAAEFPPDVILVAPAVAGKLKGWQRFCVAEPVSLPAVRETLFPPEGEARPSDSPAPVWPRFRLAAFRMSKRCAGVRAGRRSKGSSRAGRGTVKVLGGASVTLTSRGSSSIAWLGTWGPM